MPVGRGQQDIRGGDGGGDGGAAEDAYQDAELVVGALTSTFYLVPQQTHLWTTSTYSAQLLGLREISCWGGGL